MLQSDRVLSNGENPKSTDPDDARLWLSVYRDLIRVVRETDVPESSKRLGVLEARLAFWERRLAQLSDDRSKTGQR